MMEYMNNTMVTPSRDELCQKACSVRSWVDDGLNYDDCYRRCELYGVASLPGDEKSPLTTTVATTTGTKQWIEGTISTAQNEFIGIITGGVSALLLIAILGIAAWRISKARRRHKKGVRYARLDKKHGGTVFSISGDNTHEQEQAVDGAMSMQVVDAPLPPAAENGPNLYPVADIVNVMIEVQTAASGVTRQTAVNGSITQPAASVMALNSQPTFNTVPPSHLAVGANDMSDTGAQPSDSGTSHSWV